MTKYEIIFPINEAIKIIIPLKDPLEFLGPIYIEKILLLLNKQKIILSKTTIYHDMLYLADNLKKALNRELLLHFSITKDLGYLRNQNLCNDIILPTNSFPDGGTRWVGYLYFLWQSNAHFDSWIYNAHDGSIIFEVTPFYPYMYCEPEEEPDYIPYEEWIKTYKPYFITTLSRETTEQWLEQAEHIINIINRNQKRWELRSTIDVDS